MEFIKGTTFTIMGLIIAIYGITLFIQYSASIFSIAGVMVFFGIIFFIPIGIMYIILGFQDRNHNDKTTTPPISSAVEHK
jgi:uncharacterized membrane protein HdeD (DUF308 family)